eukprot:GGOE01036888.1.p1 GENE.GGOE01036888.1~~GGOE01036888.1.p1  ORF type:complete len:363 (+),score=58.51 GGOE01036888.1:67-1155(+)
MLQGSTGFAPTASALALALPATVQLAQCGVLPLGRVAALRSGPPEVTRAISGEGGLGTAAFQRKTVPERRQTTPSNWSLAVPSASPHEGGRDPSPLQLRVPEGSAEGNLLSLDAVQGANRPLAIHFGANSETVVLLTDKQLASIPQLQLVLSANARVHLLLAFPDEPLHHRIAITLFREAQLHLVSLSPGSRGGSSQEFDLTLNGEGAEADIKGVSLLLSEAHKARVGLRVAHNQPKTRCTQLIQSVTDQSAEFQFDGSVTIHRAAHDAHASQLSHNLLLHDTARVRAQPRMHILADDVTATHGATTGGPVPEALFYLRARGLGADVAQTLYWQAFVRRAVEDVKHDTLRAAAAAWVAAISR